MSVAAQHGQPQLVASVGLHVSSLPDTVNAKQVQNHFGRYGQLVRVKIIASKQSPVGGSSNGTSRSALLQFASAADAVAARRGEDLHVYPGGRQPMRVTESRSQQQQQQLPQARQHQPRSRGGQQRQLPPPPGIAPKDAPPPPPPLLPTVGPDLSQPVHPQVPAENNSPVGLDASVTDSDVATQHHPAHAAATDKPNWAGGGGAPTFALAHHHPFHHPHPHPDPYQLSARPEPDLGGFRSQQIGHHQQQHPHQHGYDSGHYSPPHHQLHPLFVFPTHHSSAADALMFHYQQQQQHQYQHDPAAAAATFVVVSAAGNVPYAQHPQHFFGNGNPMEALTFPSPAPSATTTTTTTHHRPVQAGFLAAPAAHHHSPVPEGSVPPPHHHHSLVLPIDFDDDVVGSQGSHAVPTQKINPDTPPPLPSPPMGV